MKIDDTVSKVIERIRMEFLNESRDCVTTDPIPLLKIEGQEFGPFKKGSRVRLPNWVVDKLLAKGLVDLDPESAIESTRRLQNIYRSSDLQALDPHLFAAINFKLLRLQKNRTALDPRLDDEMKKIQRMMQVLAETRLSKVVRIAKSGACQSMRKNLTEEERWLCEKLSQLLSSWRDCVIQ